MRRLPEARTNNLVVQDLGNEILIYDLIANKACCLNETSAIVWQACHQKESFHQLKKEHKFTDDLIYLAWTA
jgi:hypothetical protein